MRVLDVTTPILRHGIAALLSAALLTVLPIALYIVAAIFISDLRNMVAIGVVPLLSFALGVGTTLIFYFPLALFFQWLSHRAKLPLWLPLVMFFALSFLFFALWSALAMGHEHPVQFDFGRLLGSRSVGNLSVKLIGPIAHAHLGFAALLSSFFTLGFVVYWLVLILGQRIFRPRENVA